MGRKGLSLCMFARILNNVFHYTMCKVIRFLFLLLLIPMLAAADDKNIDSSRFQKISIDTVKLFDQKRARQIPIAVYRPAIVGKGDKLKLVVFNHGYGENKGNSYLSYAYLTGYLASKGYLVVSIQHELATDEFIPLMGTPQVVRRPFWDRGADNILFVINTMKKEYPGLDKKHITLIGHSNGADMVALFPQKYPGIADKIITLDNRRMALPRTNHPKVFSLRSSDQPADSGVLPDDEEVKQFGMTIIKLSGITHNDMDDKANETQRNEIRKYVMKFLKE